MAKFIEVTPIKYGEAQPRVLISTEKIDYVREDDEGFSVIYLKDVPLTPFTKKPVFNSPIYAAIPFISLSDEIMKIEEEIKK